MVHAARLLALGLIACANCATAAEEPVGPAPLQYRGAVAEFLKQSLFDPYSVRDAMISEPKLGRSFSGAKWNVCFRGNAKNRLGRYAGLKEILFAFEGELIVASDDEYASITCGGAFYSAFPELSE